MQIKFFRLFILCVLAISLGACRPATDSDLQGSILFWHSWQGSAATTLNSTLNRFEEIYPDVDVISVYVEASTLERQFKLAASLAFGADIMLTPSRDVATYVADRLIIPIPEAIDTSKFISETLIPNQVDGQLYGLPMTADSPALYYNPKSILVGAEEVPIVEPTDMEEGTPSPVNNTPPELVREPATSLAGLLEKARLGERVLIDTNFNEAIWGIRAFGDAVYNEDENVSLGDGFVAWLEWLQDSQNSPAMFLSSNSSLLYELFSTGQAAYYIGDSELLPELRRLLGNELVVTTLPTATPQQAAAGYLDTESLVLSQMSSEGQQALALELARFLTNREQQRRLMRELNRVPANRLVIVDERINPIVSVFKEQVNNAVANPHNRLSQQLASQGNLVYTQVLEGIVSSEEALNNLQSSFNPEPERETGP